MLKRTLDDYKSLKPDEGTRNLQRQIVTVEKYTCMLEKWTWEGIIANSLIFLNEDIDVLSDEDLTELCEKSTYYQEGKVMVQKPENSEFTFVNFNFKAT